MTAQKKERNTFELKATAAVFMTCCGDGGIALLMNLAAHNDGFRNKLAHQTCGHGSIYCNVDCR